MRRLYLGISPAREREREHLHESRGLRRASVSESNFAGVMLARSFGLRIYSAQVERNSR